jgi:hypothetical protein
MAKPNLTEITTSQTFQAWFDKTNEVVNLLRSEIVTASASTDVTEGNAIINGTVEIDTLIANTAFQTDTIASDGATNISITTQPKIETGDKIAAIFAYGASGANIRFTNNIFNWDIGIEDNTDANFILTNATTTPITVTPDGMVTLTDLTVTGNTTLGSSGSVAEIAHGAFKAGDNIAFAGPDANNQVTISSSTAYDGTGIDITVPKQVSHANDADTRIRFDHMSEAGSRNGQTFFENNGHVMMYIHGEERSTDRRVDFILKDDLTGIPTVAGATFYQATNGLGTDVGKTNFEVEGTITSGLNITVNNDGSVGNKLRARNGANIELEDTSDNVKITLAGETGNIDMDGTLTAGSVSATGNITATGDVQAGGDLITLSDARVKENVNDLENSLEKITNLRGVTYNKIGNPTEKIGFIAQELEEIIPQVVTADDSEEKIKSVAYGNLVPVLVEAIKELNEKIKRLENEKCACGCNK